MVNDIVTKGIYIPRFCCIAACAGSGLHSLFGAGRCFCLLPCAVAVTKCVGVAVNIAVAACAGVCSITLLGAGWCCHDGGVAVDMCAGGYLDIGDFKAPFVATAIADELYLDRVTIDIDRLPASSVPVYLPTCSPFAL